MSAGPEGLVPKRRMLPPEDTAMVLLKREVDTATRPVWALHVDSNELNWVTPQGKGPLSAEVLSENRMHSRR